MNTDTLTAYLDDTYADQLTALTVTEAVDVADRLRAVAAVFAGDSFADDLDTAAEHVERTAGVA